MKWDAAEHDGQEDRNPCGEDETEADVDSRLELESILVFRLADWFFLIRDRQHAVRRR